MFDFICIGDIALDMYYKVLEPLENDKKVKSKKMGLYLGGMCFNTARALRALGNKTLLIAIVGNDEQSTVIRRKLGENSLQTHLITLDGIPTMETLVMLLKNSRKILLIPDLSSLKSINIDIPSSLLQNTKVIFTTMPSLINEKWINAHSSEAKIIVSLEKQALENLKDASFGWLKWAKNLDTIIFNRESFSTLFRLQPSAENILKSLGEFSAKNLIVTLGEQGAIAVSKETGETVECKAFKVNVLDTTGAGDIFAAGFLHTFYTNRLDLKSSILFSCALASASCEQVGTYLNKEIILRALQLIKEREPRLVATLSDHRQ